MKLAAPVKLALNIVLHSKLRSWLTILGIIIGVGAVVALVSIGEGMHQIVESQLGGLGADLITISPGRDRAMGFFRSMQGREIGSLTMGTTGESSNELTKKDIQVLKPVGNIEFIHGSVSGRGEAYYLGEKASVSIEGIDPVVWKETTTSELESGRFLGSSDYNSAVVGSRIAQETFKQPLSLNAVIAIEGKSFRIIGILKESGTNDGTAFILIKSARDILDKDDDVFDSITIKASDVDVIDGLIEEIDKKLMISRHVTEKQKDYSILSMKSMQESVTEIIQSITLFLASIAAVSLLVGAVGIANTMFTTVLEKTKEIGIMKAIGARNFDIMAIFMLYAVVISMIGGLIGLAAGSGASLMLSQTGMMTGMQAPGMRAPGMGRQAGGFTTVVSPQLLAYALLIAIGVGVAAGVIPAYRASKLKPVDALRYE